MKRRQLLVILGTAPIAGCVGGSSNDEIGADDPIGDMVETFEGDPDRSEVRERVQNVLEIHNLAKTDENRQRVGNIVIQYAAKKEKMDEMTMLTCIWGRPLPGTESEGTWEQVEALAEACVSY